MKTLILGGARSGKTSYAMKICESLQLNNIYIATATAGDQEMHERIQHHKNERLNRSSGVDWQLIEEPFELPNIVTQNETQSCVLLVDCLTLWLSNLACSGKDCLSMTESLIKATVQHKGNIAFVSNEVGLGIVPDNSLARDFRDLQGRLNQAMASVCDTVVFITAGLPLKLK